MSEADIIAALGLALTASATLNVWQSIRAKKRHALLSPFDHDGDGKPGGSKPKA